MSGRLVWITGASAGIGRALALELAGRGDRVLASARRPEELRRLAEEADGRPGSIVPLPLDVTDAVALRDAIDRIESEHGALDVAVLNAGTHQPVDAAGFTAAGLRSLCELNLFATAACLEQVMRVMLPRRRGRIAVVASVAGYRGLPTAAYYSTSKAAVIAMCESLRFDLDKAGIVLQVVNPGFVRTPLTDKNPFSMPFLMEPEDAARRLADGLTTRRFEITFPRRFTWLLKLLRILPYALYFPLTARSTGR